MAHQLVEKEKAASGETLSNVVPLLFHCKQEAKKENRRRTQGKITHREITHSVSISDRASFVRNTETFVERPLYARVDDEPAHLTDELWQAMPAVEKSGGTERISAGNVM